MQSTKSADSPSALSKKLVVRVVFALVIALLLYATLAFGIYNGLTRHAPGANDFYSRWMGARALFLFGQNPYSEQVTGDIQLGMYGRLARPDEDQVAFAYPLYAAYLAAPFVALPYPAAQALWMALLILCVIAGALAMALVNRLTLSPLTLAALLLGFLFFYPSVRAIFLGQYALVSLALLALAMLTVATRHDTAAGILLAVSTVKPQPVIFLVPVILFWAWQNKRMRVVVSAVLTLALLMISSLVLVPTWTLDFLNGLRAYVRYEPVGPPVEIFANMLLPKNLATILALALSAALLAWMLVIVWRNRSRNWFDFQPTLGIVALVTTMMAVRIGSSDQVFLFIPLISWLSRWRAPDTRLLLALGVVYLLIVPWYVFLTTLEGNREALPVGTILPFSILVACVVWSLASRSQKRAVTAPDALGADSHTSQI